MERPPGIVDFKPSPTLFPFESQWFPSATGPIHYVDEGEGRPILLMHGNPDWSFLYRRIILGLRGRFRCVAADYPGFGLSVHPEGYEYTPAEHAVVIGELFDHLDLSDAIVFGQDWGGPIGLDVASRRPHRVSGLVMGNTWFWPATGSMTVFSRLMGSGFLQRRILENNLFVDRLMKWTLKADLTDEEFRHYQDVVPTSASRKAIAEFPIQITSARPWMANLEKRVEGVLADVPLLMIFGRKDPALGSKRVIERWESTFSDIVRHDLPQAGHYIQEDAPDEIVEAIIERFG